MSFLCCTGKTQKGTCFNMLWSSEGWLNPGKVCYFISACLQFLPSPCLCLLGNVDTWDCYQKKLCNQAFIAAKKCNHLGLLPAKKCNQEIQPTHDERTSPSLPYSTNPWRENHSQSPVFNQPMMRTSPCLPYSTNQWWENQPQSPHFNKPMMRTRPSSYFNQPMLREPAPSLPTSTNPW
jgi:hypothetical protein